ncbi:hypothetical protein JL720_15842 [Aureococcus anophagefferens]|nr:hypothetical protein JL720_15842 [Aureococcus anophagefferens]
MVHVMETLVVALLCAGVALVAAADEYPLGAEPAWRLGSEQYESLYSQSTVFCDREARGRVAGPSPQRDAPPQRSDAGVGEHARKIGGRLGDDVRRRAAAPTRGPARARTRARRRQDEELLLHEQARYDYVTDEPCNGASRPRRVLAALAALAGPWLLLA